MDVATDQTESPETPRVALPPIQNRFLYVDIAALRAKQLRRGALPRIESAPVDPVTGHRPEMPHKAERVAMEEVRRGLVAYSLPEVKEPGLEGTS